MRDFVCLQRQFQTRSSHLLCRASPSAASSNPLRCLSPVPSQPNDCCSQAGGHSAVPTTRPAARRPLAVAGLVSCCAEHHFPVTTANQLQMHGSASHPPSTATALSVSSWLVTLNVACSSHLSQYVILQCYITPFNCFIPSHIQYAIQHSQRVIQHVNKLSYIIPCRCYIAGMSYHTFTIQQGTI